MISTSLFLCLNIRPLKVNKINQTPSFLVNICHPYIYIIPHPLFFLPPVTTIIHHSFESVKNYLFILQNQGVSLYRPYKNLPSNLYRSLQCYIMLGEGSLYNTYIPISRQSRYYLTYCIHQAFIFYLTLLGFSYYDDNS